jgi:diacylglycerol O-acyltransferase
MDRLKSLDAEFLHLENGIAHMHIAGACVFGGTPPPYDELVALIAGKMHEIPQYRQRIRPVPFELGRPVWVDDPDFDLEYHVRHTALPAPGDDATFARLMGRLMSQPLDRERALWEVWLVEGLEDGRWALVFKVHHSMVDGVAGVQLLAALLDIDPDAVPLSPRPWTPAPEPTAVAKVLDAWAGLASDVAASTRQLAGALRHPDRAVGVAVSTVSGLSEFIRNFGATTERTPESIIGPHRTWAHAAASLAEVKEVGKAFGGTVNDVVLAAMAGSFRELLLSRGLDPATTIVRSAVPVSTRGADVHGVPDNRVSLILYDLPVSVADPVERLATVCSEMGVRKGSHMSEAGEALVTISDLAPPMVVGTISRLVARVMQRVPQRAIDTITTNVPGPQFPLYCLGREMIELRPFVPIAYGIRHSTGIMSYNGRLFFGVTGDLDAADDVQRLASGAVAAIGELSELATARRRTSSPQLPKVPKRATSARRSSSANATARAASGRS